MQTDVTTPNNDGTCSVSWEGYNPQDFGSHVQCVCLALKDVGKSFAKGRNMQHPTILAVVGQRCWVRLHGAKAAVNTRHTLPGPTDCY